MSNPFVPPHSTDSEQSVIGGLLLSDNPLLTGDVYDMLTENMFFSTNHQRIFGALVELQRSQTPCDLVTLTELLDRRSLPSGENLLNSVGGFAYLGEIAKNTPSAANIVAYAKVVKARFYQREVLALCASASDQIYQGEDAERVCSDIESSLLGISQQNGAVDVPLLGDYADGWADEMERRVKNGGKITGLCTGHVDLDNTLVGINPTDLVIVAGRPGAGKTLFTQSINDHITINCSEPAMFFSMEMPSEQILERSISSQTRLPPELLRRGVLSDEQWGLTSTALENVKLSLQFIDDTPALSINRIRARVRRVVAKLKAMGRTLKSFTIDYLGMAQLPKADRHDLSIAEFLRLLKALIIEIQVPCFLLVQLGKGADRLKGSRPQLADLRDSGAIEAFADIVLMIHKEHRYNPNYPANITEILIRKARHISGESTIYLENVPGGYRPATEPVIETNSPGKQLKTPPEERKKFDFT